MKRPFWLHQLVDYILAVFVMSQATSAPRPLVPLVLGVAMLVNAACVDGPLAAFRGLPRRQHRVVDITLLAAIVVVAVAGVGLRGSNRGTLLAVAVIWTVVILNSDYRERARRVRGERGAEEVGRAAGRAIAGGVNAWRRRRP